MLIGKSNTLNVEGERGLGVDQPMRHLTEEAEELIRPVCLNRVQNMCVRNQGDKQVESSIPHQHNATAWRN